MCVCVYVCVCTCARLCGGCACVCLGGGCVCVCVCVLGERVGEGESLDPDWKERDNQSLRVLILNRICNNCLSLLCMV